MFEYKTILVSNVPRIQCPEHGVLMTHVPWAEGLTGYTSMFETLVIDWLMETTIAAVGRRLALNWKTVRSIMQRAVDRGMARREEADLTAICIDETSFKKHHEYVTVVSNPKNGSVIDVVEGRTIKSLSDFYERLPVSQRFTIQTVAMDMWPAYINATRSWLNDADRKICFDKFHVKKLILEAVDKVRKDEHRELRENGDSVLTGTKYTWLTNPENLTRAAKITFEAVRTYALRTARAWSIKEAASELWHYVSSAWALKAWQRWIRWARVSKLEPIKRVAKAIREHLGGIINAVVNKVTNGYAESANSKIQLVKSRARGFRSRDSFRVAILFYCGKLDLHPRFST